MYSVDTDSNEKGPRQTAIPRPVRTCFISPLGYGLYNQASRYPFGGAEVQFYLLSCELARDPAYEVTVLTTVSEAPGMEQHGRVRLIKRTAGSRLSAEPAAGWLSAPARWKGYAAAFTEMYRLLKFIDADLYIHAGAGVEVGAYALICRLLRRRFVYVVVSSADLDDPYGNVGGPLKRLYPFGLRVADAIICQTEEHQAALNARYGRTSALIRPGHVSPGRMPEASASGGKTGILWVGRGHPLKQPEMFVDLAERLPKERCVMVIMQDPLHPGVMRNVRARASGLRNLTLHEDVPLNDVGRFFEDAKLFVNTSTYEGFPNTFVQAAIQAVPILSWTVDPDGVLARHGIGACAGGSFGRLVAQAEQLCAEEPRRADMGRRAREYAREYHDLQRSVVELKAMVQPLMAGTPR